MPLRNTAHALLSVCIAGCLAASHVQAQTLQVKKEQLTSKLEQISALQAEVDALRKETGLVQTVILHVRVMELESEKLRKLGLDFQVASGKPHKLESMLTAVIQEGKHATTFFNALRKKGLVKVLAEPTLVTVSGRRVSFQSGGEFPVVVPQGKGNVAIEYRSFGTSVDCVPIVLGNGRIRLEVRPTISEIDESRSVQVDGIAVPGLRIRQMDTAIELGDGETVVLGGTFQSNPSKDGKDTQETSLLLSVSAELTKPIQAQRDLKTKSR